MSEDTRRYVLDIQPEPWTASEGSVGRKGGHVFVRFHKNKGLTVYQSAVAEMLIEKYDPELWEGSFSLTFYFWRRKVQYKNAKGHTTTKKAADATNLQKALEDALQGILFKNDRDCVRITSWLMEQAVDTMPRIVIDLIPGEPTRPDLGLPIPGQMAMDLDSNVLDVDVESVF